MKKYLGFFCMIVLLPLIQSCSLVEGIFKAGMWWAFILIGLVVFLIVWLLRRK